MERREVSFRIYRYNPQVDRTPFYDNFRIAVEKGITILRALNHIKEHLEPRLTFRAFCQAGICGSCAVRINGVSKLACTTQVWDELGGDGEHTILIEPLNNLEVIRDLVVDIDPIMDKLKENYSWVKPAIPQEEMGRKEHLVSDGEFEAINAASDCILCGSCYSECSMMEVNRSYISPPVLVKAFRMNNDSRDTLACERLERVSSDHGLWDCAHCHKCMEHCTKNIPIMDGIHRLREEAFERGMTDSEGARHAQAFFDDIRDLGRLREVTLPLRTKGMIGSLRMVPLAVKMGLKGRTPPLWVRPIPDIDRVSDIYSRLEANPGGEAVGAIHELPLRSAPRSGECL
ncbi:succinate dehydrogenase and fumarate reductase iron-sulfur protein [Geobacter metallireducens RCH3]|uniref:Succinate dehydrogenase/fumarate reductase, type E, iron-sulfur protein n=1 Tax=Geobacter metallireducens (strain ATCC 53774 / DSM 7210 / GS-15) TaxID=269799 RepID=Q39YX0_GEOMG|nr:MULTISPECIES: succinate dehydrogenase/fumarate reductase iron-sulfur subunit [Geobacter]ABB30554.1 succinate dehydrogenase/fumarate reductase, type E, iron-sulfur protein [Geobacter metallireducens GS-15]EHP85229.1 succinate dehydrogenase and fumarate reductase iron-sulfur protein [Geobacter metallireducens RCH3]MBT1076351.1 succinate dehydrogenase/fumarate reductase iron-sulfur subunit [Geobacter grbiciae]